MTQSASHSHTVDVAVVGEIYIDHVFSGFERWPGPGEEVLTDHYTREIGGGAAATACGLGRLGRKVDLIGLIGGQDAAWFHLRLGAFGVGWDGLHAIDGKTGVTVSLSTAEDRSFFTHLGANGLLTKLLTSRDTVARLARARHVHFALPLARSVAETLLPALAEAGCTTSLDMGWQPVWLTDEANYPTMSGVDHLLPNEKEAELMSGEPGQDSFFAFAGRLPLRNPMLKLGAHGATGRGDDDRDFVTVAGFIDALLDGADARERLRRGCITGGLSTRAAGALGALPDRLELNSAYEKTYGPLQDS
jgi:sugar/nucleoside kinase (ribokinase family)